MLKAVMFASAACRLKFRPQDGMKVIVRGRVSVYEPQANIRCMWRTCSPRHRRLELGF